MPGSSNDSSFIPKRGTSKSKHNVRKGKVYSLTIVSYVLLFAALAASAAVFVYRGLVVSELENEITAMNQAMSDFKEADMKRVQEFDVRLRQASQRLNKSVSVSSIFTAIERATIDTVRFEKFSLKRNLDDGYVIQADIETDTFDSSIFQRGIYGSNEAIGAIEIKELGILEKVNEQKESLGQRITFTALMSVPLTAVPYRGTTPEAEVGEPPAVTGDIVPEVETEPGVETDEEENQNLSGNQTGV